MEIWHRTDLFRECGRYADRYRNALNVKAARNYQKLFSEGYLGHLSTQVNIVVMELFWIGKCKVKIIYSDTLRC